MTEIQGRNLLMLSNANTQAKPNAQNNEPVEYPPYQGQPNNFDDIEF